MIIFIFAFFSEYPQFRYRNLGWMKDLNNRTFKVKAINDGGC